MAERADGKAGQLSARRRLTFEPVRVIAPAPHPRTERNEAARSASSTRRRRTTPEELRESIDGPMAIVQEELEGDALGQSVRLGVEEV